MAAGRFYLKVNDFTPEASQVQGNIVDLTAANFDAQMTLVGNFLTALADIQIGKLIRWHVQKETQIVSNEKEPATNEFAQREAAWLVRYHDSAGNNNLRMQIPCPDLAQLAPANRGYLDITAGNGLAFKTAFESLFKGPDGLASVTVDSVKHVGRNN